MNLFDLCMLGFYGKIGFCLNAKQFAKKGSFVSDSSESGRCMSREAEQSSERKMMK